MVDIKFFKFSLGEKEIGNKEGEKGNKYIFEALNTPERPRRGKVSKNMMERQRKAFTAGRGGVNSILIN